MFDLEIAAERDILRRQVRDLTVHVAQLQVDLAESTQGALLVSNRLEDAIDSLERLRRAEDVVRLVYDLFECLDERRPFDQVEDLRQALRDLGDRYVAPVSRL